MHWRQFFFADKVFNQLSALVDIDKIYLYRNIMEEKRK